MRGRIPALDGLRGVAILLVVVFHAWPPLMRGGAYGVTLFFVLSGFLITGILLHTPVGWSFYRRRAVRLLPALFIVVGFLLFLGASWGQTWPALAYVSNWAVIREGTLGLLTHTWSLSVEEHFYIVWPVVIAVLPNKFWTTAGLLAVAVGWRTWLLAVDGPTPRLEVATDTSAVALLAGCLVAIAHFEGRWIPTRGAAVSVAGILVLSAVLAKGSVWWHWSWFLVVALATVAVSACAVRPVRVLEPRWLVWFGTVSYGLYLWHDILLRTVPSLPVAVVLSVGLASLMWFAVEKPLLEWERSRWRCMDRGYPRRAGVHPG